MLVPGISFAEANFKWSHCYDHVTARRYKSIIVQSGHTRTTVWDSVIHSHLYLYNMYNEV